MPRVKFILLNLTKTSRLCIKIQIEVKVWYRFVKMNKINNRDNILTM